MVYRRTGHSGNGSIASICGGATSWSFGRLGDALYYLVVPNNGLREGSYGTGLQDAERPASSLSCLPQEIGSCF